MLAVEVVTEDHLVLLVEGLVVEDQGHGPLHLEPKGDVHAGHHSPSAAVSMARLFPI